MPSPGSAREDLTFAPPTMSSYSDGQTAMFWRAPSGNVEWSSLMTLPLAAPVQQPFVVLAERRDTAVRVRVRTAPPW